MHTLLGVVMDKKKIQVSRKKIKDKIAKLQTLIKLEQVKLESLTQQCDHENSRRYSCCGDLGTYCPDCGKEF